jgi:hypothetical protein
MSNETFVAAFTENMNGLGLPVPNSLFTSMSSILTTVGMLAAAIVKVGPKATMAELFLTIPSGAGTTALAGATTEVVSALAGFYASFYVGACIGSVFVAAYKSLDFQEMLVVLKWARDIASGLGMSVADFLRSAIHRFPQLSSLRTAVVLAERHSGQGGAMYA